MKLNTKLLKWSAGVPVAILNTKTAEHLGIRIKDRILIETSSKRLITIVDTIGLLVKEDEIAVSSELKERLNLKKGQKVEVEFAELPESLILIKKKLDGKRLSKKEVYLIIKDIVLNSLSEAEIALFISAMYKQGMNFREKVSLVEAILETGNKLNLKRKLIVDKHSIGGIAGRVTPIIVSICASAGLTMPKTSSRAITTPAGTADAIETLAEVEFPMRKLRKIIQKTNACMVWGGALGMVPADSRIIQVEKMLNIDPEAQMLASIIAKKISVGSSHILIHLPYGKSAKVGKSKALRLKKEFEKLGKHFNKKIKAIPIKNNGPVGNGVGPMLEMIDVIKVLKREDKCYQLEDRALTLSGELLEMTGRAKKGKGYSKAKEILDSGKAFDKFKQIIKAQGGSLSKSKLKYAKFKKDIFSKKSGEVSEVDNKKVNSLARITGCPMDKSAGLYIYFHKGDIVKRGDKILTIYAESKPRLREAVKSCKEIKPISVK